MDPSNPYLYRDPAQPALPQPYASSSYSYYPNPNPSSAPIPDHDLAGPSAAAAGAIRPPGVDHYPLDPYAAHGGYAANHATAPHFYQPPVAAAEQSNLYYHAAGAAEAIAYQYAVNPFSYGVVGTRKPTMDLETKKRKIIEGGTSANSVRVCSICNVVCNSDTVFASHLAGEKHALKARGIPSNGKKPKVAAHWKAMLKAAKKAARPTPTPIAKTAAKDPITFVQSLYCEVCKINCNSQESFNSHKVGRKHMKNLQKLQDSLSSKPVSAPVTVTTPGQKDTPDAAKGKAVSEKPAKGKAVSEKPVEDLETKKRKLLHEGAAADAVRICTMCNVVCNSETVFNFHIKGQKHLAMVKKQQAAPDS